MMIALDQMGTVGVQTLCHKIICTEYNYIRTTSNDFPEKEKKSPVKKLTVDQTKRINKVG